VDTHGRSIVKALSWRVFALVITAVIAWRVTGDARVAAAIGIADTLVKLAMYYAHERIWNGIRFGRPRPPEYEI
jgi:uncharacterized membrane protein